MTPQVRRLTLFAAAAAGLAIAAAAVAAEAPKAGAPERHVIIIKEGPDGQEIRLEGDAALAEMERMGTDDVRIELPDMNELAELRDLPGRMPMIRAFRHGGMMGDSAERAENLRDMLQLTPAQEPALQAFLAAAIESRADRVDIDIDEDLTTPQRLDKMRARMAERQADFNRRADAVMRFYGQLTPSQKKVFDKLPGMDGMGMEHRVEFIRRMADGPADRMIMRLPEPPKPPKPPKAPKS